MKPVQLTPGRAWMVVARDGEMDARRVDVSEGMKRQGRLMRDDATPQSPRHCGCEIVVLTTRQHGHPIHTAADMLKMSAGCQEAELRRVDADVSRVTSRDVAMLLGGNLDEAIPDSNVRNRIK